MELEIFEKALRKKLRILPTYKAKGFAKMGLFIFFNEPPIPFNLETSMTRFAAIQKDSVDQYDFLFFGYRTGVIGYNFRDMSYQHYSVDQDAFDDMSIHARKIVEA